MTYNQVKLYGTSFFYKKEELIGPQQQMFEMGLNHEFYIRFERLHNGYPQRLFGSYTTFKKFKKILLSIEEDITFHEIIKEDKPCKLFFDLDFKHALAFDATPKFVQGMEDILNDFVANKGYSTFVCPHPLCDDGRIYLDTVTANKYNTDGTYKLSIHMYCNQIFFKNISDQKEFIIKFAKYIEKLSILNMDLKDFIDIQPYRKNGSLRTIFSNKLDEDRPCLHYTHPVLGEYDCNYLHHYFITTVPPDAIMIPIVHTPITKYIYPKQHKVVKYIPTDTIIDVDKATELFKWLAQIPDSFFIDDVNGYKRRRDLTFAVSNYTQKDLNILETYLKWLRKKRLSLGQSFDLTLDKYRNAYLTVDPIKWKRYDSFYLQKLFNKAL